MNYFAHIKKPSPIYALWRKQNLHKANLQGTLFTFNKKLQRYEAAGVANNVHALVKNPHVHLELTTEAISEVQVASPANPEPASKPTADVETEASETTEPTVAGSDSEIG